MLSATAQAESWYLVGQHYHTTTEVDFSHYPRERDLSTSYDPDGIDGLVAHAEKLGLDALFVTEHNSVATCFDPKFKNRSVLLVCGEEWTTKQTLHIGLINPPVDKPSDGIYPANPHRVVSLKESEDEARAMIEDLHRTASERDQVSLAVINHPGYDMYSPKDALGADAVEVMVPSYERPARTRKWWLGQLAAGRKITAIAGADLHECVNSSCLSHGDVFRDWFNEPLNLVFAANPDQNSLLEAIRAGRVVAIRNPTHKNLRVEFEANYRGIRYQFGDTIPDVEMDDEVSFHLRLQKAKNLFARIYLVGDKKNLAQAYRSIAIDSDDFEFAYSIPKQKKNEAVHIELFDYGDEAAVALVNPIYF
jgi:hypothetical protein